MNKLTVDVQQESAGSEESQAYDSTEYIRPRAPTPPSARVRLPSLCPAHSPVDSPGPSMILPDPYPLLPSLSSAGSSSTRSSAYTTSGSLLASPDSTHIHVASLDDDVPDSFILPTSNRLLASKPSLDHSRWSESRPRSSSLAYLASHDHPPPLPLPTPPRLREKPSYDMSWQLVDERDEVGLSDDDTDDDAALDCLAYDIAEERTSAAIVADEGRGLIVQAGTTPLVTLQIQVPPGTTHLLLGSSTTPNAMPVFLTTVLPQISRSLLALDISANFLNALPPVLAICECLEELNVASNPLRVLPVFLADLTNLRVLIADSTGIATLPDTLAELDRLHTISIRRNKFLALPSWLCLLPALQTLCIDGNPFQGPWKALVEPLLAKTPMTPSYPPSTPQYPSSLAGDTDIDTSDVDDTSDNEVKSPPNTSPQSPDEEDNTITPERAPFLTRAKTEPRLDPQNPPSLHPTRPLARTRTTPNRTYHDQSRAKSAVPIDLHIPRVPSARQEDGGYQGDHELRKMKSAGDLRRAKASPESTSAEPPFVRPSMSQYSASHSYSNLLTMNGGPPDVRPPLNRFASLGPSAGPATTSRLSTSRPTTSPRQSGPQSVWDNISENEDDPSTSPPMSNRASVAQNSPPPLSRLPSTDLRGANTSRRSSREGKEKSSRWGFLKKMSMGRMKPESPTQSPIPPSRRAPMPRPHNISEQSIQEPAASDRGNSSEKSPQIDLRFSTTGTLDAFSNLMVPSPPNVSRDTFPPPLSPSSPAGSPASPLGLLVPPMTRSSKRRSFLPVDAPGPLSITSSSSEAPPSPQGHMSPPEDDSNMRRSTGTLDQEQVLRREEERAREAYMRALRSIMAYLRDMNDLGMSQQNNAVSMYSPADDVTSRPRRATVAEREVSIALSGSTAVSSIESSAHLRSLESIGRTRSGTSSQTLSVATSDSNSSLEERKFKDDKGKRAMVIREIVVTERTYVKGLQELVDIYIKPAAVPVNLLSGVGATKDSVVPASERKIVFGGLESLFSFHKDSFFPALEIAAAPLMKPAAELAETDVDGQLSMKVAKDVGNIFWKHAAFMKMYSTYINNFDNSVERIKYWTSDRPSTGGSLSPSASTVHLASLGLAMSAVSPTLLPDPMPNNGALSLSTSQRKRIKTYLKRCRLNPRHTQLNLEGYLLLPVQRIPRYRLLLEELLRSTPPSYDYADDPLERGLSEISSLANNMNEGKRESESRRKLVKWQARIKGRFPSPLVQPHRRLIMDGPLLLTRVVRKATVSFEAINAQGDQSTVQVDCLAPELTPRPLTGILCNDLLVLCRDPSEGKDPNSSVDLWAVLRMQTLPQPASIVHGNVLRLVDNKAILYFDAPSPSDALNWFRAINLHIPASKA